jgi:hypothetical protein
MTLKTALNNKFTHNDARSALEQAYKKIYHREPSEGELDFGLATAFHETRYGRAGGQFARWAGEGKFNWGALESGTPGDEKTLQNFKAAGLHPTKEKGQDAKRTVYFYLFPNDVEAAQAFLMSWGKPDTLKAASSGSAEAVARSMKNHNYYEGFWVPPGNPGKMPMPPFKEAGSKEEAQRNNIREYASALTRQQAVVTGKSAKRVEPEQVATNTSPSIINSFLDKINSFFSTVFGGGQKATAAEENDFIVIVGAEDTETKIEYARILQSVLNEELNVLATTHKYEDDIEVSCRMPFGKEANEKCLKEICKAVADTFEFATKKIGGCQAVPFILSSSCSRYPEMNIKVAEVNRRKFQYKFAQGNK